MRSISRISLALCLAALSFAALEGCAKKKPPAPATPPPAPAPTTPTPTPAPTTPPPTPVETPKPPVPTESDFQPAFFDFDASTLRDDARSALDADAKLLRANADLKVVIEGHCDERGTVEFNQALGEQRANAARDYLVSQGIDTNRLHVVSYGKEKPFATGHDEASWQQNRRAHFRVAP